MALTVLTRSVGALERVHLQRIKHLKVRFLHLNQVVDGSHLTGHNRLWSKTLFTYLFHQVPDCSVLFVPQLKLLTVMNFAYMFLGGNLKDI